MVPSRDPQMFAGIIALSIAAFLQLDGDHNQRARARYVVMIDLPDFIILAARTRIVDQSIRIRDNGHDRTVPLGDERPTQESRAVINPISLLHGGLILGIENEVLESERFFIAPESPTDSNANRSAQQFPGSRLVGAAHDGVRVGPDQKDRQVDVVGLGVGP